MDLGMVGFDGLASSDTHFPSDPDAKHKLYGSGFLKQERPISEDDWKGLKMAKTDDDDDFTVVSKPMLGEQRGPLLRSNTTLSDGQQMLSFSLTDSKTGASFPLYHQTPTSYCTNTGYGSGGLSAASIHGVLTGARGPFTPSQWMELEHQALIYKYILANIPVPSNLLFPIKKAFESAGFSGFSVGPLRTAALGWSGFHLGFSNNTDPEPGRCRRTDGKKWRCSRDAVPDQKYCERHINRGRHRSRKPVEGQSGHSVSGPTSAKLMPMASSSPSSVVPGGGGSNSLSLSHLTQVKNFQPGDTNRTFLNKENEEERTQAATDLSMLSSTISIEKNQFSTGRQQNPSNESSRSEFGLVFSDSLLNPLQKNSSQKLNDRERTFGQSVRQFMDEWPQNQTNRTWPDVDLQADNTQLSISIPMSTSDFMSSTSSPTEEKFAPSPLRLSKEVHIGEPNHRQANWWETSVGGPLGEVLHNTNTSLNEFKNSSVLNLMTQGWNGSPQLASSPTGPLQRMAFGSQSNSSAGSSPRAGSAPLAPLL